MSSTIARTSLSLAMASSSKPMDLTCRAARILDFGPGAVGVLPAVTNGLRVENDGHEDPSYVEERVHSQAGPKRGARLQWKSCGQPRSLESPVTTT